MADTETRSAPSGEVRRQALDSVTIYNGKSGLYSSLEPAAWYYDPAGYEGALGPYAGPFATREDAEAAALREAMPSSSELGAATGLPAWCWPGFPSKASHFCAIGTDGLRPVVWGVGSTEAEALADSEQWLDDSGCDRERLRVVEISAEQRARIEAGTIDADLLGID